MAVTSAVLQSDLCCTQNLNNCLLNGDCRGVMLKLMCGFSSIFNSLEMEVEHSPALMGHVSA